MKEDKKFKKSIKSAAPKKQEAWSSDEHHEDSDLSYGMTKKNTKGSASKRALSEKRANSHRNINHAGTSELYRISRSDESNGNEKSFSTVRKTHKSRS